MVTPIVVVGTDTGVGKTFVTCALARALVASGKRVVAVKPVESGCLEPARRAGFDRDRPSDTAAPAFRPGCPNPSGDSNYGEALSHEDGVLLARATGQSAPTAALVRLRAPLAPALAAEKEAVVIDLPSLVRQIGELGSGADVLLVEGAGGVLSPLTWKEDITDVAKGLGAKVLVVAANRLGVIHHVRSALRVLEAAALPVLGVVLSTQAEDDSTSTNREALQKVAGAPPHVLVVPRGAEDAVRPVCDWVRAS